MKFQPGRIYHVFNQGNNRQTIFYQNKDYLTFLNLYKRLFTNIASTIAWCLMSNHFHFLILTDERCNKIIRQGGNYLDPITNGIRKLLSGYARIFNNLYDKTGSLFRQKTKAICLTDIPIKPGSPIVIQDYYINCFKYIHQNPLKARLIKRLEDWEFSSFKDYAGLRNDDFCSKEMAVKYCDFKEKKFIENSHKLVEQKFIDHIV